MHLQILYPSVTCDHKAGYQVIPMWAWQGRKVQKKKKKKKKLTNKNKQLHYMNTKLDYYIIWIVMALSCMLLCRLWRLMSP